MYHPDDVEDVLSPTAVVDVVEYLLVGGVLNYCNFKVYLLIVPRCSYRENHFVFHYTPMFLSGELLRVMSKNPLL